MSSTLSYMITSFYYVQTAYAGVKESSPFVQIVDVDVTQYVLSV